MSRGALPGKENCASVSPFSCEARTNVEGRSLTAQDNKTPSISMKMASVIFAHREWLLPITQLLFITFKCVYFDGFVFILFFLVVDQKYDPIWRQCTTWCFSWPFQSGVTTAVGGTLKKCQLAIKVPQTSIMSSSYESLGAAQNWAIMYTVKNGCWGPQHSVFPLIITQHRAEAVYGRAQAANGRVWWK